MAVATAYTRHLAAGWSPSGGDGAVRLLLALGAWRFEMPTKRSRTRFRLAMREARLVVLVESLCAKKGFYIALGDVYDAMLLPGPQLRLYLVLG